MMDQEEASKEQHHTGGKSVVSRDVRWPKFVGSSVPRWFFPPTVHQRDDRWA